MRRPAVSYLDSIRTNKGETQLRKMFRNMAEQDVYNALGHLNDVNLQFPALYILIPEIQALNLFEGLNRRNIIALKLCAKKIGDHNMAVRLSYMVPGDEAADYDANKWIFISGVNSGAPEKNYDGYAAVIDAAAAKLLKTYDDKTILTDVVDLIFKRNRRGLFIHDLVWAFFQTFDRSAIELIAKRLTSKNRRDMELARLLLHLEPSDNRSSANQKQFSDYVNWARENSPYIYLTGEHFQMKSNPEHICVDHEAKYLCKAICPRDRKLLEPLSESEAESLKIFRGMPEEDKAVLASYSNNLHSKNKDSWADWMKKNIAEQVMWAKASIEVV